MADADKLEPSPEQRTRQAGANDRVGAGHGELMMEAYFKDCAIEGMLAATGQWVRICEWSSKDGEFDATGWVDAFGDRIGTGTARMPDQGWIDFTPFAAVRPLFLVP